MKNSVAALVQTHREHAGLTQAELAQHLGVSQQSIAKWESGKSLPRFKVMEKLVHILGIPKDSLDGIQIYRGWAGATEESVAASKASMAAHGDLPSRSALNEEAFPPTGTRSAREYAAHFKNFLSPRLEAEGITGEWDTSLRIATMNWQIDFCNENLVVQFIHAKSIAFALRGPLYARLWRMAALRSMSNDKRYYLAIIVLRKDENSLTESANQYAHSSAFQNEIILRRITAEAPGLGLSLYVARTPDRVVSLLNLPKSLDEADWDSEYDDLDPE